MTRPCPLSTAGAPACRTCCRAVPRRLPRTLRTALLRGVLAATLPALAMVPMAAAAPSEAAPAPGTVALQACQLRGVPNAVRCGQLARAEDPDVPAGRRIGIGFAVVPALADPPLPDPVFVLAGGPGQSAISMAGPVAALLATLNLRRDLVFVDQRGTGRSAPLACQQPGGDALAAAFEVAGAPERLRACLRQLRADGNADLRQYATWIAVGDLDAVRAALGYAQVNLWGVSYGTRVALEWLRQFPATIRSAVLDGTAPPDMVLPASLATDADAALDALLARCRDDARCERRFPDLAGSIDRLVAGAAGGQRLTVTDPLGGAPQPLTLERQQLASLLRAPLYVPAVAAVLPHALARAAAGDGGALVALSAAFAGRLAEDFAEAMHFAVVCAEDVPRIDAAARAQAARSRFGTASIDLYESLCREVPTRPVPAGFYTVQAAAAPVLLLSGGADPVTPPRHGARIAQQLGNARHLVAPQAGHGISALACMPEQLARFVRTAQFAGIDDHCLATIPAPTFFYPPPPPAASPAGTAR